LLEYFTACCGELHPAVKSGGLCAKRKERPDSLKGLRQKYYDYFSRFYDRFVTLHSGDRAECLRYFLADKTGLRNGDKVLDICTGTGTLLRHLKARVGEEGLVAGVDFSMGMLRVGKAKTRHCERIFLICADAACLPLKEGVCEAATCSHAFYELKGESQDSCLHEVGRVLKPGKPFLMLEHDVPQSVVVRMLFYIRLLSMGPWKAIEILRHEGTLLKRYFRSVEKVHAPTGRSKVMICRM
jgi:demethylmenaquinone methyltransferase/2-methoxy-6-polyprenyl-1,4-benzoquinol methylase